jgi:hypothetical protein
VSECANEEFSELVGFTACGKRGAKPALVSGEATFGLRSMTVLPARKAVVHHSAIAPLRRPWGVSRIERDDGAANPEFLAAEHVIVLGIVAFVGQQAAWPKVRSRLADGVWKVGRVLTGTARRDGTYDQLGSRVKHSCELRPRGVRRLGSTAPSLEVHRCVPRFQARRVNCRGAVVIVSDQTAGASALTASSQQLFKPPFSSSFCSMCHSVEWSGTLASPKVVCNSAHSLTIVTIPRKSVRKNFRRTKRANN